VGNGSTLVQPHIPGGFVELLPGEQRLFNQMLDAIRQTYELFGFLPIETPAIEFASVLLAKGAGQTDKQVFWVRDSKAERPSDTAEPLCLHFDLTVPLARYFAQHREELTIPFRRYQIQKVWRGEKQQKGRFREFYQCDIDVIGASNPLVDAEIAAVVHSVFTRLNIPPFTIRISNRKILTGLLKASGLDGETVTAALHTIDKTEKIGPDAVQAELQEKGLDTAGVWQVMELATASKNQTTDEVFASLNGLGLDNPTFLQGVGELRAVIDAVPLLGIPDYDVRVDLTVARGLDYYTGTVYETYLDDHADAGSICSGGRFDDLVSNFLPEQYPAVGISIGATRLFDVLRDFSFYAEAPTSPAKVLVCQMGGATTNRAIEVATLLRTSGIPCELSLEETGVRRQVGRASRLGIQFAVIIGEDELAAGRVTLKDMLAGEQKVVTVEEVVTACGTARNR